MVIVVRAASPEDVESCLDIVRGLPKFFTPDVPETLRADLGRHSAWVIDDADEVVGVRVVDRRSGKAVEILWAAVQRDRRGQGVGTLLIQDVLRELAAEGVSLQPGSGSIVAARQSIGLVCRRAPANT